MVDPSFYVVGSVDFSERVDAQSAFPILCGAWPSTQPGARQVRCINCQCFLSISPKGWTLHQERPEVRPLLCEPCFIEFAAIVKDVIANWKEKSP